MLHVEVSRRRVRCGMEKTYSSSEIQRIAKITKMQAIHWTQTGIIVPLQDAQGRGSRRVYSWENLIEMMICRELNRYNVERSIMREIVHDLNGPGLGSKNYWEYLNQNPKEDALYLVISIMDIKEVGDLLIRNLDTEGKKRFANKMRKAADDIEATIRESNKIKTKANPKNHFATTTYTLSKEQMRDVTETNRSCVVVNVAALIAEAKLG